LVKIFRIAVSVQFQDVVGSVIQFMPLVKIWLLFGKNYDMKILNEKEYFYAIAKEQR